MPTKPPLMTFASRNTVGAFSVITNLRMDLFEALTITANALPLTRDAISPRHWADLPTAQHAFQPK